MLFLRITLARRGLSIFKFVVISAHSNCVVARVRKDMAKGITGIKRITFLRKRRKARITRGSPPALANDSNIEVQ